MFGKWCWRLLKDREGLWFRMLAAKYGLVGGRLKACSREGVEDKMAIVAQMLAMGWDEGGEAWNWRSRLWAWEEALVEECRNMLLNIVLQVDLEGSWRWTPDLVVGYTVSGAYRVLTSGPPTTMHVPTALLWRKDVPLKVSMFAWCLFRNRLPTKTNLFLRGIITSKTQLCVSGRGQQNQRLAFVLSFFWPVMAAG
uniref:H+-transporting two-sector ATPase, alpha/beta subunit, central region, related n=1 Tax=Medicago truncatula TaxID=3880 RepID=Q2HUN8_MEDTR|nr:H+-transporting two-sector ATPase, alpha/beta subunit, central region, related [Medicago truncatula]